MPHPRPGPWGSLSPTSLTGPGKQLRELHGEGSTAGAAEALREGCKQPVGTPGGETGE